jgi:DNA-binding LytR/AlgR family response regulator
MPAYLIIEDEPLAARRLERLIRELEKDVILPPPIDTVQGAVQWLGENRPDLLFLDIHLADGLSFSIFDQVKVEAPVIFTTAYDQYALRAFRLNSVDYLLKPIEAEELSRALAKYHAWMDKPAPPDWQALAAAFRHPEQKTYQKRFLVNSGDKIRSVPVEEVAYFYGQQKYVFLISRDKRRFLLDYTLGELEDLLDPDQFFRVNRQFIVSFGAIQSMAAWSKSRIKVELSPPPDEEAIVSTEKSKFFKEWLNR